MFKSDLIEEIIYLIDKKVDLEILQLESGLSIDAIQDYQKQLDIRKKVNEAIKNSNVDKILNDLKGYIEKNDYHIVEKFLFLKLNAYKNREMMTENVLAEVQKEAEDIGLSQNTGIFWSSNQNSNGTGADISLYTCAINGGHTSTGLYQVLCVK